MAKRDIIVLGTSAGGVQALPLLVSGLPRDLDAAVFIVLHIPASGPDLLAQILQPHTPLPVISPADGDPIVQGRIYVARPDHHLLIEEDRIRITRGPRENRHRPSVDALFRSAAYSCGARVIGVILTGNLDDGTAGLWAVKQRGGMALVQDPRDAAHPSMPESALRYVAADGVAPLGELAALVVGLTREPGPAKEGAMSKEMQIETKIAREDAALLSGIMGLGSISPFTCPECHGVLVRLKDGGVPRFRCHTGHAFSIGTLLAEVTDSVEDSLWSAIRAIEESIMLLNHLAQHVLELGDSSTAELFAQKAKEAQQRADTVRGAVLSHEILGPKPLLPRGARMQRS